MKRIRGLLRIIFGRTTFVIVSLLIQVGILIVGSSYLSHKSSIFFSGISMVGGLVIIYILNKRENPGFKLAWMVPIAAFPVFGILIYIFMEFQIDGKLIDRKVKININETAPFMQQDGRVLEDLYEESRQNGNLAAYIYRAGNCPVYENTYAKYYSIGEDMFEAMKEELLKAQRFIFMEYFIVERGLMWNSILEILEQKVKEGVEVRFMYDGTCCMALLPYRYPKELEDKGIRAKMFSPIRPALSTYQNNRDHRKILVIDGHTAFTGGINLADEYINKKVRFGHWKDTGIMLKGDAVTSFTMMFLQLWNVSEKGREDYGKYLQDPHYQYPGDLDRKGFVIPYGDSPLDKETVGEQVYLDIINTARTYVHIMTPYLILNYELIQALTFAAKRGVETVVIMPHIPDKKYAFLLAKAHYAELIEAGVQIYEYTPGFVHAKVFSSDDCKAVVGTINMDFRSLYLHFECAAYLYKNSAVREVERDFQETLRKCQNITLEDCREYPWYKKFAGAVLKVFAPLM